MATHQSTHKFRAEVVVVVVVYIVLLCALFWRCHRRIGFGCLVPSCFTDSHFLAPQFLGGLRLAIVLYLGGVLIFFICLDDWSKFKYYSVWSLLLLFIYFVAALSHSLQHYRHGPERVARFFYTWTGGATFGATWVLFCIACTNALVVDVVLWAVIYPQNKSNKYFSFGSFNMHGINLILILTELLLSKLPLVPGAILLVSVLPLAYTLFLWLKVALGGSWVYSFMNAASPWATLWYLLVLCLHIGAFLFMFGIGYLRDKRLARPPPRFIIEDEI